MKERDIVDHFRYFTILTHHLDEVRKFIEFDYRNMSTFSMELSKLVTLSGAEIGNLIKAFACSCDADYCDIQLDDEIFDMDKYKKAILTKYPRLVDTEITIDYTDITIRPWGNWSEITPTWWIDYVRLKNYRVNEEDKGNLKNVLYTLSAHLVLLMYIYCDVMGDKDACFSSLKVSGISSTSLGRMDGAGVDEYLPDFR